MTKHVEVEFYSDERPTLAWDGITHIKDDQYKVYLYSEEGLMAIIDKGDIKNLVVESNGLPATY